MPQPGIGADGRFVGATDDYHQDNAVQTEGSKDSGKYYREADWAGLVRKPTEAVGPKQVPLQERVSLNERAEQINASRYGTRVNPASKERGYALDGTETEAFIDPRRNLDEHVARPSKTEPQSIPLPPKQIAATVLFETTAVGAKLRNTHKVGGERVKEMDHFVASVETPRVITKLPDVAPYVISVAMKGAAPLLLGNGINLYVQDKFRAADGSVSSAITAQAQQFYTILSQIMTEVLQRPVELLRVFYVATLRADVSVASYSEEDGKIWVNALAFQQSQAFDHTTKTMTALKRACLYWTQRLGMELAKLDGREGAEPKPTGLYDRAIFERFTAFLKSKEQNGF